MMNNSNLSAITLIRLSKDDELIEILTKLAVSSNLHAAQFSAIGACNKLVLSYYNLDEKKYEDHEFDEDMEITGIIGNIGWMDGKPIIHAHGTFGRKDLSVSGGHVKKLVVSATCEITLTQLPQKIERAFDPETGLNLIKDSF
jgi:predicted DNA-binding protein with PD1-like motif